MAFDIIVSSQFGVLKQGETSWVESFLQELISIEISKQKIKWVLGTEDEQILRQCRLLETCEIYYDSHNSSLLRHCQDALLSSTGASLVLGLNPLPPIPRLKDFLNYASKPIFSSEKIDGFAFSPTSSLEIGFFMTRKGKTKLRRLFQSEKAYSKEDFHWSFPHSMAKQEHSELDI